MQNCNFDLIISWTGFYAMSHQGGHITTERPKHRHGQIHFTDIKTPSKTLQLSPAWFSDLHLKFID